MENESGFGSIKLETEGSKDRSMAKKQEAEKSSVGQNNGTNVTNENGRPTERKRKRGD